MVLALLLPGSTPKKIHVSASKRVLLIAVLLAVLAVAVLASCGLQGEIFLVSDDGKALPAPGAQVSVYRVTKDKSYSAFYVEQSPLDKEYFESLTSFSKEAGNIFALARQGKIDQAKADSLMAAMLNHEKWLVRQHCSNIQSRIPKYFGYSAEIATADRNGRFSLHLWPGRYLVWVSGRAGQKQAEWLEQTGVLWRSYLRLVTPLCSYDVND